MTGLEEVTSKLGEAGVEQQANVKQLADNLGVCGGKGCGVGFGVGVGGGSDDGVGGGGGSGGGGVGSGDGGGGICSGGG